MFQTLRILKATDMTSHFCAQNYQCPATRPCCGRRCIWDLCTPHLSRVLAESIPRWLTRNQPRSSYPLVICNIAMEITTFTGTIHYKWPFSICSYVSHYQRVVMTCYQPVAHGASSPTGYSSRCFVITLGVPPDGVET